VAKRFEKANSLEKELAHSKECISAAWTDVCKRILCVRKCVARQLLFVKVT
jgi:hypothetical protein